LKFPNFIARELDEERAQDSFRVLASGVTTVSSPYLQGTSALVNMPVQPQERLVFLDHFPHCF
jgi:hypothetical protein